MDIFGLLSFGFIVCIIALATIGRIAFTRIVHDNQKQETDKEMKGSDQ